MSVKTPRDTSDRQLRLEVGWYGSRVGGAASQVRQAYRAGPDYRITKAKTGAKKALPLSAPVRRRRRRSMVTNEAYSIAASEQREMAVMTQMATVDQLLRKTLAVLDD
jgi:hypothetical protein